MTTETQRQETPKHAKHYEVQVREGTVWTIQNLYKEEAPAVEACAHLWKTGAYKAVRVLREKFDPKTNTFDAAELTYQGQKFKVSEQGEKFGTLCDTPADLYLRDSRQVINRLLVEPFSKWQITAMELLHCPRHYYRLDNAGQTLLGAVQKTAVAQCKGMGQTVQERMKTLYALIGSAVKRAKSDWDAEKVLEIGEGGLQPVIEALDEKGEEREFLLAAALAKDFQNLDSVAGKITRLLSLIDSEQPDWVIAVADRYISEFLAFAGTALEFVGSREDMAATLVAVARFARGKCEVAGMPGDGHRLLHGLLADQRFPETRRVLLGTIARALSGSERLKAGTLDEELAALSALAGALGESIAELLGDNTLINIFEDRSSRFLNAQFVGEYLQNCEGPEATVARLLALEAHCFGREAKRRLANFLLPALGSHESELYFTRAGGNKLDRMRHLATLQGRVLGSGMDEPHKKRMADLLDKYCAGLLAAGKLLERLEQSSPNALEAAKYLLTMIAGGCFTRGQAMNAVRRQAKAYFAVPDFTDLLGRTGVDQAAEAIALNKLIQASGLDRDAA